MDKHLLKTTKIINSWEVTRDDSKFADRGDVVFIYNDKTSASGRLLTSHSAIKDWYFYVKNEPNALEYLKNGKLKYVIGKDWIRIYVDNADFRDKTVWATVIRFEQAGIPTFEADVGPSKRLCLDYDVQIEDFENIRVLYIDIETDDTIGEIKIGRDRILSFAAYDQTGKSFYITNKNEKDLLLDVDKLINKYDMLVGWNSYKFDIPYLKARYKVNGVSSEYLWNVLHEDMMKRVYYFYSKEPVARQEISSYSLESISQYFLKEGKVKHKEKIIELFNKYPERLKEYNIRDAELLYLLEKKCGTISHTYRLSQMCQIFGKNWSMVKAIDNFILQDGNKKGIHFKTNMCAFRDDAEKKEYEDEVVDYVGALVLTPKPGFYKNVYDLDFRSLYPNIIRTFNLSPETMLELNTNETNCIITPIMEIDGLKHGGRKFKKEPGIVPGKIGILLDERMKLKKTLKDMDPDSAIYKNTFAKQWVTKDLANSFYGVLGNKYFRSYSHDAVEAITITGQFLLTWVSNYLTETGRVSVYGDTDSVFAQFKEGENVEDVLNEVNTAMTEMLMKDYGVVKSTLELGFDCLFSQFIIESKKKYTGLVDGKLRSRGMELVKRDSIALAVRSQKELLDLIFKGKSESDIKTWVDKLKLYILEGDVKVEDIVIRKRMNKSPKDYKSKSLHVILAEAQGHGIGDILHYVITDGSKKLQGVPLEKFTGSFDRNYYWNNAIYPMLIRVLQVVWPDADWEAYYVDIPRIKKIKKSEQLTLPEINSKNFRTMQNLKNLHDTL